MEFKIPQSLKLEHEELQADLAELAKATQERGKIGEYAKAILTMTDRMKSELPQMLDEHKAILAALKLLMDEAANEKKMEYVQFSNKLILHAQNEEEVLYPASMLVGEYLKLKNEIG